jgi:hypothetical protein
LFKLSLFFVVLSLAVIPFAASAQVTAPTPPPVTTDDVQPTPAPPERFVMVDGAVTGKTYNELAPGTSTGGWGIKAVDEIPIIGHNWAAQVDYRSYNYQHTSTGATPNGFTFACPAGNPGCVTPIGYQTYDRVFNPGPMNFIGAFGAQDSTTQISLGSKIAPIERYYLSAGYVFRGTNAPGYPTESGMGFGLDKLPDVDRTLSFYGNFWVFFNVGGNTTGPASAALGTLSGYPFTVSYRLFTYRLGATFKIPKTPVFLDVSDVGDRADVTSAAPSDVLHNMLFLGVGTKF